MDLKYLGIEIVGLGHYLPRRKVENEEILNTITEKASNGDTQILGDVGVNSRYWCSEDETVAFMAEESSVMALRMAGISHDKVDLLVLSNWTSRLYVPDIAPQVATNIKAVNALAFDICCACCGFISGVITASMYLLSNPSMKVAVVTSSEQFSKGIRPQSKGQLIAGDAAGAVVLVKNGTKTNGVIDYTLHNDGSLHDIVRPKMPECWIRSKPELISQAVDKNSLVVGNLLDRNNLTINDLDWYVPHPGTALVHDGIKARLDFPDDKFIVNFDRVGNTSSASIPLVLSENYHNGKFKNNDLIVMSGIGSGFYYGGLLISL